MYKLWFDTGRLVEIENVKPAVADTRATHANVVSEKEARFVSSREKHVSRLDQFQITTHIH